MGKLDLDRLRKYGLLALLLPVLGMLAYIAWNLMQERTVPKWELALAPIHATDAEVLEELFNDLEYQWPLSADAEVPPVTVDPLPQDLAKITDVKLKKSLFFRSLLPLALAENHKLQGQRRYMLALFSMDLPPVGSEQRQWLETQLTNYRIEGSIEDEATRAELARRLDEVPVALVLAQAANESAWGTSRFAREGKNLFGEWTYKEGEGLIPEGREDGDNHAVRIFPTLRASVKSYFNNINSGRAYEELRLMREQLRNDERPLDALKLASGLSSYSERGEAYVEEIKKMIRSNRLNTLRDVSLNVEPDS